MKSGGPTSWPPKAKGALIENSSHHQISYLINICLGAFEFCLALHEAWGWGEGVCGWMRGRFRSHILAKDALSKSSHHSNGNCLINLFYNAFELCLAVQLV